MSTGPSRRCKSIRRAFSLSVALLALDPTRSAAAVSESRLPLLTTAQQVRQLTPEEAQRGYPVKLSGVITFHHGPWYLTYVQDDTAGIYVAADVAGFPSLGLAAGQRVEIEGISVRGKFAPFVHGRGGSNVIARVLGLAPLPVAVPLSSNPLNHLAMHCRRVEVEGIVRGVVHAEDRVALELDTKPVRVKIVAPEFSGQPAALNSLLGARIKARGVYATLSNQKRQLTGVEVFVSSLADLESDQLAPPDPFTLAIRSVPSLLRFSPDDGDSRARVQGVVTLAQPGASLYLRSDGVGLWVQTRHLEPVAPGDFVDVVGFPAVSDSNPVLQDAIFRVLRPGRPPEPTAISAEAGLAGSHDSDLVSIEALLLEVQRSPAEQALMLQIGQVVVRASLTGTNFIRGFTHLRQGNWLRVAGICRPQIGPAPFETGRRVALNLIMRSPGDVIVLAQPSWWTMERARQALMAALAAALVALVWVLALRRRVHAQTETIRRQLERETLHEERARIARELHDTLQQELVGIGLQLDAAAAQLNHTPAAAKQSLNLARDMVRHSEEEARQSIWDLRSRALDSGDLAAALRGLLMPLRNGSPLVLEIDATGAPFRLPRLIENNLLRIAQEAVTNALKHARASRIQVRLDYDETDFQLSVFDNGVGFDTDQAMAIASRHFGLLGMRERAEKMSASLEIRSRPGAGTAVQVRVPGPIRPRERKPECEAIIA